MPFTDFHAKSSRLKLPDLFLKAWVHQNRVCVRDSFCISQNGPCSLPDGICVDALPVWSRPPIEMYLSVYLNTWRQEPTVGFVVVC